MYDAAGHSQYTSQASGGGAGDSPFTASQAEDLFRQFFGKDMGFNGMFSEGGFSQTAVNELKLSLSFDESVQGCTREVSVRVQGVCDRCHGYGGEPGTKEHKCPYCRGSGEVRRHCDKDYLQDLSFFPISSCMTVPSPFSALWFIPLLSVLPLSPFILFQSSSLHPSPSILSPSFFILLFSIPSFNSASPFPFCASLSNLPPLPSLQSPLSFRFNPALHSLPCSCPTTSCSSHHSLDIPSFSPPHLPRLPPHPLCCPLCLCCWGRRPSTPAYSTCALRVDTATGRGRSSTRHAGSAGGVAPPQRHKLSKYKYLQVWMTARL